MAKGDSTSLDNGFNFSLIPPPAVGEPITSSFLTSQASALNALLDTVHPPKQLLEEPLRDAKSSTPVAAGGGAVPWQPSTAYTQGNMVLIDGGAAVGVLIDPTWTSRTEFDHVEQNSWYIVGRAIIRMIVKTPLTFSNGGIDCFYFTTAGNVDAAAVPYLEDVFLTGPTQQRTINLEPQEVYPLYAAGQVLICEWRGPRINGLVNSWWSELNTWNRVWREL